MASYEVRPVNFFADFMAGRQVAEGERRAKRQNALADLEYQRAQKLNALSQSPDATPEDYIRAGDAQTGNALLGAQQSQTQAKQQAAQQFVALAQRALEIPAEGRKAFLKQAAQMYAPAFAAMGVDPAQSAAELDGLSDADLEQRMQQVAQMAPKQAPIAVSAGASLVDPRKPTEAIFTAPTAAAKRTVEWKDAGDRLVPVYSDTGEDVPGLAPKAKGITPGAEEARDGQRVRSVQQLRKEFRSLQSVKDYEAVLPLIKSAQKAPDTPQGDLQLIYTVGKILDPGSVVREGELQLTANAAPYLQQMMGRIRKEQGQGRLTPQTRTDMLDMLRQRVDGYQQAYTRDFDQYTQYAKEGGTDPASVVGSRPEGAFEAPGGGAADFVYVPGQGVRPAGAR